MTYTHSGWLCVLGPSKVFESPTEVADPATALVVLPTTAFAYHDRVEFPNEVAVNFADTTPTEARCANGRTVSVTLADILGDMLLDPMFAQQAGLQPGDVPLALIAPSSDDAAHVYIRIRLEGSESLFVRLTETAVDGDVAVWLATARAGYFAHRLYLGNHQCYYYRRFAGTEIEHKYQMPADADIYHMCRAVWADIRDGGFPGYALEFRDGYQAWDYDNQIFEVCEPEDEAGYISFIPLVGGGYTLKRKWFTEDQTARREVMYKESGEVSDRVEYLRDRFGVEASGLPAFRRVRYDVNLESTTTGNVFGIFFDEVTVASHPQALLRQCEVEYLRTRSVLENTDETCLAELEEVAQWLERFLADHNVAAERGVYSKLSFLRDVVSDEFPGELKRP